MKNSNFVEIGILQQSISRKIKFLISQQKFFLPEQKVSENLPSDSILS